MKITVATAQYPISKHKSFDHWRLYTQEWIKDAARKGARLLLFPEYGSMELVSFFPEEIKRNICLQVQEIEKWRSDYCNVFAELARKFEVTIVAPTIPVQEKGEIYNRAYVFSPAGLVGFQDKFFMTRFEDEVWGIKSAPKVLSVFETTWGSFGIQICYDMEFSMGAQMLSAAGTGLILTPSCTEAKRGSTRVHIGARARALENQVYTVVSQTIGDAPWSPAVDTNYGVSAFYCTPDLGFPEEGILNSMTPQAKGWLLQSLDFTAIETVRNSGKVFNFRDHQKTCAGLPEEEIQILKKYV